jgi:hypothetical protein
METHSDFMAMFEISGWETFRNVLSVLDERMAAGANVMEVNCGDMGRLNERAGICFRNIIREGEAPAAPVIVSPSPCAARREPRPPRSQIALADVSKIKQCMVTLNVAQARHPIKAIAATRRHW